MLDQVGQDWEAEFRQITTLGMELGTVIVQLSRAQIARDVIANSLAVAEQAEKLLKKAETSTAERYFAEWDKKYYAPHTAELRKKLDEANKKLESELGEDGKDVKQAALQLSKIMSTLTKLDAARKKKEGTYRRALLAFWTYVRPACQTYAAFALCSPRPVSGAASGIV